MYFRNQSNSDVLGTCRIRIDNSLSSPDILERVAEYGYDEEKMQMGKSLLEKATALHEQQAKEYDDQYAATREYDTCFDEAQSQYMTFVKVARIAFQDDMDTYQRLGLLGQRARVFNEWLSQVRKFYHTALKDPDILAVLSNWNITQDKLEAGLNLVKEAIEAQEAQVKESGEAQQATQKRDEAIEALYHWTNDYQKVAVIALQDDPQLLEKIGILVKA